MKTKFKIVGFVLLMAVGGCLASRANQVMPLPPPPPPTSQPASSLSTKIEQEIDTENLQQAGQANLNATTKVKTEVDTQVDASGWTGMILNHVSSLPVGMAAIIGTILLIQALYMRRVNKMMQRTVDQITALAELALRQSHERELLRIKAGIGSPLYATNCRGQTEKLSAIHGS